MCVCFVILSIGTKADDVIEPEAAVYKEALEKINNLVKLNRIDISIFAKKQTELNRKHHFS